MVGEPDELPQAWLKDGIALYSWAGTWSSLAFSCRILEFLPSAQVEGNSTEQQTELKQWWGDMRCWNQFYCLYGVPAGMSESSLSWLMTLFV